MSETDSEKIFSLKGRVAVVTGAGGLLGHEHCKALADAGATVVACDLKTDSLQDLTELGMIPHSLDVCSPASLAQLGHTLKERWGGLDVLVNNAAINESFENPIAAKELSQFETLPVETFRKLLEVNVLGVFLCCQRLGPLMFGRKHGSIINVASTYGVVVPDQDLYKNPAGEQAFYKTPAYPVSKAAVIHFTKYLARYWKGRDIRVNTLSPGGVENGQDEWFLKNYSSRTPLGRMAQPRDYRGALVFLASSASAYMNGANLLVDGGFCA